MKPAATPVTAALAGIFSGLTWPLLWPLVSGTGTLDGIGLVLGTILLIGLPAHAFVIGFRPKQAPVARAVDAALLVRVGAWLASAASAALLLAWWRGNS